MPSESHEYLRVGLTGGIGSGKSVVAGMFAHLGRTVLSADAMAKELMITSAEVKGAIIREFGAESYHHDGSLNRSFLAERIFSHPSLRRILEGIVHPAVIAQILARISHLSPELRHPYVVVEAALIYESGFDRDLDRVVLVEADEAIRLARVSTRDGLTEEDVRKRMRAQLPDQTKSRRADFVLRNNGSLEELRNAVCFLDRLLAGMVPS